MISKKLAPQVKLFQKSDFLRPHFGGFLENGLKKLRETKLRSKLNNFTQKLDFDVLWFRRREYKIYKEKTESKKTSLRPKVGW